MGDTDEGFQDYMDGGFRRYGRSVAKRPVAKRPVAKRPVAKRPVAMRPVAMRPSAKKMARLFGGFFESLEQFASSDKKEEEKEKTSTGTTGTSTTSGTTSTTSSEQYMEPLKRGGAKRRVKKPVAKGNKIKKIKKGGYEQDEQEQEDFEGSGLSSAISSILSGGAFRRSPRRVVHKRPVAKRPVAKRPVAKRPVAKRTVRRSASPARRMRFM